MCGIVGLFLKCPRLEPELGTHLAAMLGTMRDRGPGSTWTKKGGNFGYGARFARAALSTWRRERKLARTGARPEKIHSS